MRLMAVSLSLISILSSLVAPTAAQFLCTPGIATPVSSGAGGNPDLYSQIAETGCKVAGTCKHKRDDSLPPQSTKTHHHSGRPPPPPLPAPSQRLGGQQQPEIRVSPRQGVSVSCPSAGFDCYYAIEMGGLFCLSMNGDLVTEDGLCGNLLTGMQYACGGQQQQQAGGGGGGSGGESAGSSGTAAGSGGGTGDAGSGGAAGSGLGGSRGRPNQGSRMGLERRFQFWVIAVLVMTLLVL